MYNVQQQNIKLNYNDHMLNFKRSQRYSTMLKIIISSNEKFPRRIILQFL